LPKDRTISKWGTSPTCLPHGYRAAVTACAILKGEASVTLPLPVVAGRMIG